MYGFSGHEKIDEVSGSGNTVDMGDRWLDVRLGRTHKLDRHKSKYPAVTPYAYALNSPLLFNDPDGKDARISIKRNNNGGGIITISTVAHVYGNNAEATVIYANNIIENLNTSSTVEIGGKQWEVVFDIKFELNKELKSLDSDNKGLTYAQAKNMRGVNAGDNFICTDCLPNLGNLEDAQLGGSKTKSPIKGGAVHGLFHNLGFKDNYKSEGDVLSKSLNPIRIDQKHFENIANTILKMDNREIENGIEYPSEMEGKSKNKNGEAIIINRRLEKY